MKPLIYIFIIIFLTSCGIDENINNSIYKINSMEEPTTINRNGIYETNENKYYENEMREEENDNIIRRSEKIGNYLLDIDNIGNVSVVINGKFCIIAIEPDTHIDDKDLLTFKRNISNKVKEYDHLIKYVTVTTSPDLVEKARDMANFKSDEENNRDRSEIENMLPEDIEEEIINLTPLL